MGSKRTIRLAHSEGYGEKMLKEMPHGKGQHCHHILGLGMGCAVTVIGQFVVGVYRVRGLCEPRGDTEGTWAMESLRYTGMVTKNCKFIDWPSPGRWFALSLVQQFPECTAQSEDVVTKSVHMIHPGDYWLLLKLICGINENFSKCFYRSNKNVRYN